MTSTQTNLFRIFEFQKRPLNAMPVTEFAYFAVKPGKRVLDDSTPEGVIMTREWETACLQPGAHRAYWAMQIEDPTKLVGFLDWDRVEDHHDWLKTE